MAERKAKATFVDRLEGTRSVLRRFQVLYGGCWAVLVVGCGLVLLAGGDYWLELAWSARAIALGVVGFVAVLVAVVGILVPIVWWSRPRTAVEIEARFPQLGQRARTVVQFSGREPAAIRSEGVMPNLVTALEAETDARARPLDLSRVIPWWRLAVAALLAGAPLAVLLGGLLFDWESRVAVSRAMLSDRPYTTLTVSPGDVLVDEGDDLALSIELAGRVDRQVVVYTRSADKEDAPWHQTSLPAEDAKASGDRAARYETRFAKVVRPVEYRVVAGPAKSDLYHVTVRYPMTIARFEATVTPPAYTGLEEETVEARDLDVIEGSRVRFGLEFDRPCTEAILVLTDPSYKSEGKEGEPPATRVPLKPDQGTFAARMQFHDDKLYWIEAMSRDGHSLPENRHRVRVRKDQAPRVHFEDPDEALEVHPIAEVLMRIRASDDFGLSRAGIVFQVNNGEERTLLADDFLTPVAPRQDADERSAVTRAVCQEMLRLEDYELTPTDSITYYAFAEDNFPAGARRTETDLRFIDVRPFKRIYKVGGT